MTTDDGVSVAVPAFNAASHLAEALDAILAQTVAPAEVVVTVDAASTDETLAVARRFEPDVTVVEIEPTTSMRARDLAARAGTAPLLAPCDADDVWLPHKLERQVAALAAHPDHDGVFCAVTEFVDGAAATVAIRRPHERIDGRVASALLVRRGPLGAVGGFHAEDHLAQWIEWLSVALSRGLRFGMVDEVLVRRRLRPDSYTSRNRADTGQLVSTVRDHLRRLREDGPGHSARP